VASRRAAERLIVEGKVTVDGKPVTELGTRVDPQRSVVTVEGRRISAARHCYVVLHKPRGTVCTLRDPEGRKTIVDLLADVPERVVPVGRLDYDTSGVLLLTNDGELAARLTHPSSGTVKRYVAKVMGRVDEAGLGRWQERIDINGKRTQPAEVKVLRQERDKTWLEVTLREGKNRQIHRLGEHAGHGVMRLSRVSFADIGCDDLPPGKWRYLTAREVAALKGEAPAFKGPLPQLPASKGPAFEGPAHNGPTAKGVAFKKRGAPAYSRSRRSG
jgi:23S rRNA pseudouridine2605 synthase